MNIKSLNDQRIKLTNRLLCLASNGGSNPARPLPDPFSNLAGQSLP